MSTFIQQICHIQIIIHVERFGLEIIRYMYTCTLIPFRQSQNPAVQEILMK